MIQLVNWYLNTLNYKLFRPQEGSEVTSSVRLSLSYRLLRSTGCRYPALSGVAAVKFMVVHQVSQFKPLDLAGGGLGEFVEEPYPAGVFVEGQGGFDKIL